MKIARSERICVKVSCVSGEYKQPSDKNQYQALVDNRVILSHNANVKVQLYYFKVANNLLNGENLNVHQSRDQNIDDDISEYLKILYMEQELIKTKMFIIQLTVLTTKTTCFYKLYCAESLSNCRISVFFALYLELLLV